MTLEELNAIKYFNAIYELSQTLGVSYDFIDEKVKQVIKVGHWIKIDDCSNSGYYCSKCNKKVVKEGWSDTVKIIKYCPNCGVKMQGVEE